MLAIVAPAVAAHRARASSTAELARPPQEDAAPGAPTAAVPAEEPPARAAVAPGLGRSKRMRAPRRGSYTCGDWEEERERFGAVEWDRMFRLLVGGDHVRDFEGIVCSGPWADAALAAMSRTEARGRRQFAAVYRSLFTAGVYPPRDAAAGYNQERRHAAVMVTCPECGRDCPPSAFAPVDLPGRPNGTCPDCYENSRAPGEPPEGHYRRTKFARIELEQGATALAVYELADFDGAGQVLSRQAREERRLRELESEERLKREIRQHLEAEARAATAATAATGRVPDSATADR